jgi:hypothetical protein
MTTRVFEPAYNFRGITPMRISDNYGKVIFLLVFYVLYTLWYGFSIMLIFEGVGISATSAGLKKEA